MMSSLHFVVHPLPGTEEQLNDRIKELGNRLNGGGAGVLSSRGVSAIAALKEPIKQVAIGPSHIAVLTESGAVGRFVFSINTDALDLNKPDPNKGRRSSNKGSGGGGSSKLSGRISGGSSGRRLVRTPSSGGSALRAGSGSVLLGSSSSGSAAVLPVQYVPEDLVSQAQVVLQGKSRSLIIRELQRTNLDVNLAVNNLLSRDDEDGDDNDDSGGGGGNSDSYVPDDLISLLDSGIGGGGGGGGGGEHPSVIIDADGGMFSDDMFGYSGIRRWVSGRSSSSSSTTTNRGRGSTTAAADGSNSSSAAAGSQHPSVVQMPGPQHHQGVGGSSGSARDRGSGTASGGGAGGGEMRWRERHYSGPRKWLSSALMSVRVAHHHSSNTTHHNSDPGGEDATPACQYIYLQNLKKNRVECIILGRCLEPTPVISPLVRVF